MPHLNKTAGTPNSRHQSSPACSSHPGPQSEREATQASHDAQPPGPAGSRQDEPKRSRSPEDGGARVVRPGPWGRTPGCARAHTRAAPRADGSDQVPLDVREGLLQEERLAGPEREVSDAVGGRDQEGPASGDDAGREAQESYARSEKQVRGESGTQGRARLRWGGFGLVEL